MTSFIGTLPILIIIKKKMRCLSTYLNIKLDTYEQRRRTRILGRRYIISIRVVVITNNNDKVPAI